MILLCRAAVGRNNGGQTLDPLSRLFLRPWDTVTRYRRDNRSWYAERDHLLVILLALGTIIAAGLITYRSKLYGDFSRAGAIVALIGLFSGFIGFRHRQDLQQIALQGARQTIHRIHDVNVAELLSLSAVFVVTSVGTLIWAYGDVFLEKICVPAWTYAFDSNVSPSYQFSVNLNQREFRAEVVPDLLIDRLSGTIIETEIFPYFWDDPIQPLYETAAIPPEGKTPRYKSAPKHLRKARQAATARPRPLP